MLTPIFRSVTDLGHVWDRGLPGKDFPGLRLELYMLALKVEQKYSIMSDVY